MTHFLAHKSDLPRLFSKRLFFDQTYWYLVWLWLIERTAFACSFIKLRFLRCCFLLIDWLKNGWSKRDMTGFGGARRLCTRYLKKYKSRIAAARVLLNDLVQYGHDCRWIWRETVVFKLSTRFGIDLPCSQSCGFHLFAMHDLQQNMAGAGSLAVILQPAFLPFVGKWFILLF